jgi:hypothetical protein
VVKRHTIIRAAVIAASAVGMAVVTALPAGASTSHEFVNHADGAAAGEVWFNSGLHATHHGHPEHGFNSFTIKDLFCGDGWGVGVEWQLSDETFTHQGTADCEPVEVTYETGQASTIVIQFNWRPFVWAVDGLHDPEYGEWQSDWMGSNSTEGDVDLFSRTTVYNDRLAGDDSPHTFTASMFPTVLARAIGAIATPSMWRDLQERTPLPASLTADERESMYKQLWCHAEFGRVPAAGGPSWDIESARPNISWWQVVTRIRQHGCNW